TSYILFIDIVWIKNRYPHFFLLAAACKYYFACYTFPYWRLVPIDRNPNPVFMHHLACLLADFNPILRGLYRPIKGLFPRIEYIYKVFLSGKFIKRRQCIETAHTFERLLPFHKKSHSLFWQSTNRI